MREPSILKVNDIFWSFQGEGLKTGTPSIFLRLSGCSRRCAYCDTKAAWNKGRFMEIQDIVSEIDDQKKKYPDSQVVITGGEPLEQDLSKIVKALQASNYFVALETNGHEFQDIAVDWWTLSPKDVNHYHIDERLFHQIDEVKLIVNPNLSLNIIKRIREIGEGFPIFLQPDWYDKKRYQNTYLLFQQCQREGIRNIRSGIQLHKIFKVR